ncbi:hypothetical protein [Chitinophaga sp. CF418]|uniref:hypothetical protein n=1 Tax=Chitinophaga sp. CF418 TaxID=1855287 RepID=UPI000915FC03|nr:hypothetical protein [Chitinophaga sp. CF418]SHN22986.1 hypothetical protein SAMN05216311_107111 [Chitinophaga sp. CF418]
MPLFRTKSLLCAAILLVMIIASAFRPVNSDKGKMRLRGISTAASKTVISYNEDKSIAQLLTIYQTAEGGYSTTRIPVYKDGRLIRIFMTDEESSQAPALFSSFEYSGEGSIRRIIYYLDGAVHGYDSLAYDNNGQISARYFFNDTQDGLAFENNSCQFYTWNNKGNIVTIENMGRVNRKLPFTLSSTTTYMYDDHPNAQHSISSLCYLTDIAAENMSANNIVTETITPAVSNNSIVKRYSYTYNAERYPTRIITRYAVNNEIVVTELEWD